MDEHKYGTIVVLNRDLFFGVKIGNTLRGLGYAVSFVKTTNDLVRGLSDQTAAVVLGIIDLSTRVDWDAVADMLAERASAPPVLAFGSHLDVEGRRAAKRARVTRVLSNGDFHRDMVALVERYARHLPAATRGDAET